MVMTFPGLSMLVRHRHDMTTVSGVTLSHVHAAHVMVRRVTREVSLGTDINADKAKDGGPGCFSRRRQTLKGKLPQQTNEGKCDDQPATGRRSCRGRTRKPHLVVRICPRFTENDRPCVPCLSHMTERRPPRT